MKLTRFGKVGLAAASLLVGVALGGCGGDASIGEECGESGVQAGECEDGAICGQDKLGDLVCLKICYTQSDCQANEECNGVEGSTFKGCRAR